MTVSLPSTAYSYSCFGVQTGAAMPTQDGQSFSSSVMRRMLRTLLENGALKKSNLCNKAGLNYNVCTKYVNFLAQLHWMEIRKSDGSVTISISDEGIANLRKLELQSDKVDSNAPDEQVNLLQNSSRSSFDLIESKDLRNSGGNAIGPRKKRIIIVDDDDVALATYSAFLETAKNLEVHTFSNSKKALEFLTLDSGANDLVLLDIRMPGMSGLRLYQAVKAANPSVKIIFISSLDAGPELTELFSDPTLGTKNFLRKPISRANFIETVSRAVS